MSLLTAANVKSRHIFAGIYFIFLKNLSVPNLDFGGGIGVVVIE